MDIKDKYKKCEECNTEFLLLETDNLVEWRCPPCQAQFRLNQTEEERLKEREINKRMFEIRHRISLRI